ncbi:MAG: hydrogenase accessory protein HypB [bacterium]|nr:MAG: hydrogenase accessory protein HypB [bacterium]
MCDTCGCNQPSDAVTIQIPGHKHEHNHSHHDDAHSGKILTIEQDILTKNNLIAERNREYFKTKGILALNLMSSPGAGKTTLLERTITDLKKEMNFCIIEGDQQTFNDANRIQAVGAPVVQINTGKGCHLDAEMISKAVIKLNPSEKSVLIIENVGNLVCPALFDLGESERIVIISVTEGDDKPIKYPNIFDAADICVINKIDLLPYVDFNLNQCKHYALQVNHHLELFDLSVKTGDGMENWYKWLKEKQKK